MNEAEFRAYAKDEGFREPENRSQPPNRFFDTHVHKEDLIVLVTKGVMTVDYGERQDTFTAGDMCQVAPGIEHSNFAGTEGAIYFLAWRTPTTGLAPSSKNR